MNTPGSRLRFPSSKKQQGGTVGLLGAVRLSVLGVFLNACSGDNSQNSQSTSSSIPLAPGQGIVLQACHDEVVDNVFPFPSIPQEASSQEDLEAERNGELYIGSVSGVYINENEDCFLQGENAEFRFDGRESGAKIGSDKRFLELYAGGTYEFSYKHILSGKEMPVDEFEIQVEGLAIMPGDIELGYDGVGGASIIEQEGQYWRIRFPIESDLGERNGKFKIVVNNSIAIRSISVFTKMSEGESFSVNTVF